MLFQMIDNMYGKIAYQSPLPNPEESGALHTGYNLFMA